MLTMTDYDGDNKGELSFKLFSEPSALVSSRQRDDISVELSLDMYQ